MNRAIFKRMVMSATLVLLPSQIFAQEEDNTMSFSEDEVEAEPPEEAVEEEAASEEATEETGEDVSEADILSALSDEGDVSVDKEAAAAAGIDVEEKEKSIEARHPIWAVQQIYALRRGRLDVQPSFGISMNDPYMQHQSVNLGAAYYITEVLAAGVSFNFYRWLEAESELNFEVSRASHQIVPINQYFWGGQLNFTYVPMYGKFALFGSHTQWIFHWDVWILGGGGFIFTRPQPVIDPDFREFDFKMKFCFNLGIGGRLYLTRFAAIYLELRDYIFPEELESLETFARAEDRRDPDKWLQEEHKLTNNVMFHVGLSLFIPFTFEYELPK